MPNNEHNISFKVFAMSVCTYIHVCLYKLLSDSMSGGMNWRNELDFAPTKIRNKKGGEWQLSVAVGEICLYV